jgi:hypothetical protein
MAVRRIESWFRTPVLERDLRRLNDVLAGTELERHYWVWGGVLLGWAREGRLLRFDADADFALRREDLPRLAASTPALARAGFRPHLRFTNNDGVPTELVFRRRGINYEFFLLDPAGDDLRYYLYGWPPDHLFQLECVLPRQRLVEFEFLGRRWLRPDDVDLELTSCYGQWQVPCADWDFLADTPAVRREPWVRTEIAWRGEW